MVAACGGVLKMAVTLGGGGGDGGGGKW